MRKTILFILLVIYPILLGTLYGQTRGYTARPCGFDMNDNGIVGEPEDCNVGDGVTLDPDGDGVDEDIIYVHCQTGSDTTGTGSPQNPFGSIPYAFSQADGPGDGAEDIIVFAGVCTDVNQLSFPHGGLSDTKIQPATGSEEADWVLPMNPIMLIGWDMDNDGQYPPYDVDDTAILDGTGFDGAITIPTGRSNVEIAHFVAREYGTQNGTANDRGKTGGFASGIRGAFTYMHDLSLIGINRSSYWGSSRIVFAMGGAGPYFYLKNTECLDCGGYFTRYAGAGPYRFQNLHVTLDACDSGTSECEGNTGTSNSGAQISKMWGYLNGVEWLDSIFDGQPRNRILGGHPATFPGGIDVAQCAQDYVI